MPSLRLGLASALLLTFCLAGLVASPATAQWPPEIKNLKHFPEGTEFREIMPVMRGFAMGLGVRCQYCHVGEEGQPLSTFDFASDEKETKLKARAMLAMVDVINGDHLAKLAEEGAAPTKVQCVTCHHGLASPEQLRDVLVTVGGAEGAEAAVAKYRELREEHYGDGAYNFSEATLVQAAEALAGTNAESSVALLNESLVHSPQSSWALGTLAGVEMKRGNTEAAVAALKSILEFEPDNARVQQQIEKLMAPPAPASEEGS